MTNLIVYVAGAYSAPTPEAVQANVDRAIDAGNRLLDLGIRVRVPHLSHYQHARRARSYEIWMEIDFAEIRGCGALLRLCGASSGADREVTLARELGIPVFFSEAEVVAWASDAANRALATPGRKPNPWRVLTEAAIAYAQAETEQEFRRAAWRLRDAARRWHDGPRIRGRPAGRAG